MPRPMRNAGITKEVLLAEMEASSDPKIRACVPKLRAVKGWTVDQLFEILCEMKGVTVEEQLGLKK
jgi:hypothetical protein